MSLDKPYAMEKKPQQTNLQISYLLTLLNKNISSAGASGCVSNSNVIARLPG